MKKIFITCAVALALIALASAIISEQLLPDMGWLGIALVATLLFFIAAIVASTLRGAAAIAVVLFGASCAASAGTGYLWLPEYGWLAAGGGAVIPLLPIGLMMIVFRVFTKTEKEATSTVSHSETQGAPARMRHQHNMYDKNGNLIMGVDNTVVAADVRRTQIDAARTRDMIEQLDKRVRKDIEGHSLLGMAEQCEWDMRVIGPHLARMVLPGSEVNLLYPDDDTAQKHQQASRNRTPSAAAFNADWEELERKRQ